MCASVMAGFFCVISAMAAAPHPASMRAYKSLTTVELQKARQPKFQYGIGDLSKNESRYQEKLPLQLRGAIKTVSSRKYKNSRQK